ncbi:hypothetical protein D918_02816 [Trichuris suis]|nr:hypothetical protein D918_02816 [Trichuris suis]
MLDELHDRINKAETVCNIGTCKHLRDPLLAGRGLREFKEMMKKYDECMGDCRMIVRKEYDLVEELERKEDYWKNVVEIQEEMSPRDAAAYWGQIRVYFKNLDEEERKYELIKAALQLTDADKRKMEKLDQQIRKQDRTCKTGQCAPIRILLLEGKMSADNVRLSEKLAECMKECKQVVAHKERKLDNLKKQEDYLRNMEEIRAALSVLDALIYFDEIRSDLELFD